MRTTAASLVFAAGVLTLVEPPARLKAATRTRITQSTQPLAFVRARGSSGRRWIGLAAVVSAGIAAALAISFVRTPVPPADLTVQLAGTSIAPATRATIAIAATRTGATMTLEAVGLPASAGAQFYELWWVDVDKRHVSCGSFRVGPDGAAIGPLLFSAAVDLERLHVVEITVEQDDGDPLPGPHVASATVGG